MSENTSGTTAVRKLNPDGTSNVKYVDVLDEDKPIANQKFVCVSFVSPETILKQKNVFYFEKFLRNYELSKSMEKYHQFLNFIAFKYNLSSDVLLEDFKEFAKEEIDVLKEETITNDYKNFLDAKEEEMEADFNRDFQFQTSVRGIKVRGVYPSLEEAELRCKMLREIDPNHDVYVGPVGLWMPWEPEAYKTGRVEYMEDELNQLMHEKNKNQQFAKAAFEKRVKETKTSAIEENIKNAESANVTLTQDIDEDGNFINIGKNTQEETLNVNDEVSVADIRSELFEGDNIVMDADTDKGLSKLSEMNVVTSDAVDSDKKVEN
tara:strand:+ start:3488 stop:4450 length:963 start_codon:yes stop_codon:yes gene_type:complete